jgi:hypothetical protein
MSVAGIGRPSRRSVTDVDTAEPNTVRDRITRDGRARATRVAGDVERDPGPLADEKLEPTTDPSEPEPQAAEVESARLLANHARGELRARGLDDEEIRRLADEYIALDIGEDLDAFIRWALERRNGTS